jgi:hypothetical protein
MTPQVRDGLGPERTAAFAVTGVVIGLANVGGQIAGGILLRADLQGLVWRPVFLLNVPVGVISLIVGPFVLPQTGAVTSRRLDSPGALLSAVGLGMLMYPLIEGRGAGWPLWSVAMLLASPVVLAAFFLHQRWKTRHALQPLLDTNLLSDRAFALGALLILAFFCNDDAAVLLFHAAGANGVWPVADDLGSRPRLPRGPGRCIAAAYQTPDPASRGKGRSYQRRGV